MAQQEFLRMYSTPQETLTILVRTLNHILNNLNSGGYISIEPNSVQASMLDVGVGANQINGSTIPIIDAGGYYTSTTVELALAEIFTQTSYGMKTVTDTTTLSTSDKGFIICNKGSGFTVNLPTAVGNSKLRYFIKNIGAGTVTIDPYSSETIDGSSTKSLTTYQNMNIVSDGSNWLIAG